MISNWKGLSTSIPNFGIRAVQSSPANFQPFSDATDRLLDRKLLQEQQQHGIQTYQAGLTNRVLASCHQPFEERVSIGGNLFADGAGVAAAKVAVFQAM
jgi:hypothetical protein